MKNFCQTSVLVVWLILSTVLGGMLTLLHSAQLPVLPSPPQRPSGQWCVTHILEEKCGCSQQVLHSLLTRAATPGVWEKVVFADGSETSADLLRQRGFDVDVCAAEDLKQRCGQVAAPLLVVRNPEGIAVYAGAYAPRSQMGPQDQQIVSRLRQGQSVAPMAPLGCAISRELQDKIDPLGLKYRDWR